MWNRSQPSTDRDAVLLSVEMNMGPECNERGGPTGVVRECSLKEVVPDLNFDACIH